MRGRKLPGGHRRSVKRDTGGDRRKYLKSLRRDSAYGCEHPPSHVCELCRPGSGGRCLDCGGEGGGGTMDPDVWFECASCSGTGKVP